MRDTLGKKKAQRQSQYLPLYLYNSLNSISKLIPHLSLIVLVVDIRAPQLRKVYIEEIEKKWAGKAILTIFSKKDLAEKNSIKKLEGEHSYNLLRYSIRGEIVGMILSKLGSLNLSPKESTNSLLIVGGANSGKSSLINLLIGRKKVRSCDEAGTTRCITRHKIPNTNLIIYDTPGLFPERLNYDLKALLQLLAFMPASKGEKVNFEEWAFQYLVKNYPRELKQLTGKAYHSLDSSSEGYFSFLKILAEKYTLLEKGGSLSVKKAEQKFINLIRSGKIGKISWTLDE